MVLLSVKIVLDEQCSKLLLDQCQSEGELAIKQQIHTPISHANYFKDKIHFDQTEKFNMYGVVHVMAVDGHSRIICAFISIPRKNPIMIYHKLMRPLLLSHGLCMGASQSGSRD